MDENGNINEEGLNKLLKMADILDGKKKRNNNTTHVEENTNILL